MQNVEPARSITEKGLVRVLSMPYGRLAAPKPLRRDVPPSHTWRGRAWNLVEARWYCFAAMEAPKQKQKIEDPIRNWICEVYPFGRLYRPWLLRSNRTRRTLDKNSVSLKYIRLKPLKNGCKASWTMPYQSPLPYAA